MKLMPGFRRLPGRPRAESDAEVRAHLDMRVEELVAAGVPVSEARARARREFGDVARIVRECEGVQRQIRLRRGVRRVLDSTLQDFRFAVRGLVARPLPGLAIVLILALGLGSVTAVLGVTNALFLRGLPGVRDPGSMVEVVQGRSADEFVSLSYPVMRWLQRRAVLTPAGGEGGAEAPMLGVAGFDFATLALVTEAGDTAAPDVLFGLQVTDGYFEILGTRAHLGRLLPVVGDDLPAPPVAVISHSLWTRRFGADSDIVGREVHLNGTPVRVVGVAEPRFQGHAVALQVDLWVPIGAPIAGLHTLESMQHPRNGMLDGIGRLAPGVEREAAAARVGSLAEGLLQDLEGPDAEYPVRLGTYANVPGLMRAGLTGFLAALMAIALTVLAITCVNVTNLQLSRTLQRSREIAVRASLGAGRGRMLRQLVLESLCLFVPGALIGGTVASLVVTRLVAAPEALPVPGLRIALDVSADLRLLSMMGLVTLAAGIVSGIVPAWHATRTDLTATLRTEGGNGASGRFRLRSLLVGVQVGATVLLLVVAGLFVRSLAAIATRDLGFEVADVQVATLDLELAGYPPMAGASLWPALLDEVRRLPGVQNAGLAHKLPLSSRSITGANVAGNEPPDGARAFTLSTRTVSDGYFETLGVRLLRGRGIEAGDGPDDPAVVVLNETMATRLWPDADPLGQTLYRGAVGEGRAYRVVGVAEDGVYHDLDEATPGFGWFSATQHAERSLILHVRTAPGAGLTRELLQSAIEEAVPGLPVLSYAALEDRVRVYFFGQRLAAWVAGTLAAAGIALAVFGVYGLTAFQAARRSREIGVRMALGATVTDVTRGTLVRGLRAPLTGALAGLVAAALLARLLASLLVGIRPTDPLTYLLVIGLLLALCGTATWLPARRAARMDPATVLRAE